MLPLTKAYNYLQNDVYLNQLNERAEKNYIGVTVKKLPSHSYL